MKPVEYAAALTAAGILTVGLAGILGVFVDNRLAVAAGVVLWLALSWIFARGLKRQLLATRAEEQRIAEGAAGTWRSASARRAARSRRPGPIRGHGGQ